MFVGRWNNKPLNRLAALLVTLVGAVLGALPYLAFLGSRMYAAAYLAGTILVALVLAVWWVPPRSARPRLDENLRALSGYAGFSAIVAWYGIVFYGLAYGVAQTIQIIADRHGLGLRAHPNWWAFWVSSLLTLIFGLGAPFLVSRTSLATRIDAAGPTYGFLLGKRRLWWAVPSAVAGAALAISTFLFLPNSWWWYLVSCYLIIAAGGAYFANEISPTALVSKEAIQALQKLYGVLGYHTVVSPRTKTSDANIDSMFKWVDILATRGQDALAIEVKTHEQAGRAVSAADASFLPVAARAVSRFLSQDLVSSVRTQPILVLVDRQPTVDLARLAQDEDITVLTITKEVVREVLKTEDEIALRELAKRYLSIGSGPTATAGAG
jgi:hypothetical protein